MTSKYSSIHVAILTIIVVFIAVAASAITATIIAQNILTQGISSQALAAQNTDASAQPANPQILKSDLLMLKYNAGGLCPGKWGCGSEQYFSDGTVVKRAVNELSASSLTLIQLARLEKAIANANLDEVIASDFTETCPAAYDGGRTILIINQANKLKQLDSCKDDFSKLNKEFTDIMRELET